jgi:hypothetical protein
MGADGAERVGQNMGQVTQLRVENKNNVSGCARKITFWRRKNNIKK